MAKWISVCTHLIRVQLAERNVSRISNICYANTHIRNNAYGNIEEFCDLARTQFVAMTLCLYNKRHLLVLQAYRNVRKKKPGCRFL